MAKECRISGHPFTGFRWVGALRRWKETIICAEVARAKNCCMSCLNDLEYAVPFHVRDHVMDAIGEGAPTSAVNKEFHWANKRQRLLDAANNEGACDTYEKLRDNIDKLKEFAELDTGPVRWEQRAPLTTEEQERLRQRKLSEKRPPADQSITSLYIGGVPPAAGKAELLPYFLPYGEVRDLTVDKQRLAAIVTYTRRAAAEAACEALYGQLTINRTKLRVSWARRKGGAGGASSAGSGSGASVHHYYGSDAKQPGGTAPPPPPSGGAFRGAPTQRAPPGVAPPPGVRLPPGVKRPAPPSYPSMDPERIQQGVRPDLN